MSDINTNSASTTEQIQKEMSNINLADLWAMFWNHKWWYVFSIIACLFVAAFRIYKTPNVYSRSEKVIIDQDSQNSLMRELTSFSGTSNSRRYGNSNVDNELEAFSSPDLMELVVARLGLETAYVEKQFMRTREMYQNSPVELQILEQDPVSSYSFELSKTGEDSFVINNFTVGGRVLEGGSIAGHLGDTLQTEIGRFRIVPTSHIGHWKNDITISWVKATYRAKSYCGKLSVSFTSKMSTVAQLTMQDLFPNRAEAVLSALLDVYDQVWLENRNKSVRATSDFIADRLRVIESELGGIENSLKSYKQVHKITDIAQAGSSLSQQSTTYGNMAFEVNSQLAIAQMIRDFLNDSQHDGDLLPANSGLDNSNIAALIAEYNKTVLTRDRALSYSSENNPLVQDLSASLSRQRLSINRSVENLISTLTMEARQLESRERDLLSRVSNTSGQEMELLSIERQQKVKEQLYIFLLQKREENELQSLLNVAPTRLIMRPTGGGGPIAPNRMMILLIALVVGFGLPFGIIYLLSMLDMTVKTRGDLSQITAPFLAEIPQLGLPKNYWKRLRTNRFDNANTRIQVEPGKRNSINEAFRLLRTNLDQMIHTGGKAQVIMLTSFNPNAGKTFIIMNLAASMALKGSKVVIVDADIRKATLSKAIKKNNTGLSAFLSGKYDNPKEHLVSLAENLDLLPVGTIPPNPAELLVSDRLSLLLDKLRQEYDYIFLDCPPADLVADTSIIAPHADITICVLRAGLFDKRALPSVEDLYQEGRYNRMAIILNGVDTYAARSGYGYGYAYGYGHGYGYGYGYGYGESDEDKQ